VGLVESGGLGQFRLPLAALAGDVRGARGRATVHARSREKLSVKPANPLAPLSQTAGVGDSLSELPPEMLVNGAIADKWLVDPAPERAFALAKAMADLHQQPDLRGDWTPPRRIVYVSCNPATLARDAGLLVHQAGYRCTFAGVVNMFSHTAHVESMAVFDLDA